MISHFDFLAMISLFGLSLLLFILRLSCGTKFWHNLQNDSPFICKKAVIVERLAKKLCKQELDLNFLVNCRDKYVYPKFTRWKNIKSNSVNYKSRFYRKILLDDINNKHRSIKEIRKRYQNATDDLNANLTYFRQHVLKIAITRAVYKKVNIIKNAT